MPFIRHASSSQIHSTSYDPIEERLTVRFNCPVCRGNGQSSAGDCPRCNGQGHAGTYAYPNVSADKYGQIRDADSVGSAFHRLIKSNPAKHPHERIA